MLEGNGNHSGQREGVRGPQWGRGQPHGEESAGGSGGTDGGMIDQNQYIKGNRSQVLTVREGSYKWKKTNGRN